MKKTYTGGEYILDDYDRFRTIYDTKNYTKTEIDEYNTVDAEKLKKWLENKYNQQNNPPAPLKPAEPPKPPEPDSGKTAEDFFNML